MREIREMTKGEYCEMLEKMGDIQSDFVLALQELAAEFDIDEFVLYRAEYETMEKFVINYQNQRKLKALCKGR